MADPEWDLRKKMTVNNNIRNNSIEVFIMVSQNGRMNFLKNVLMFAQLSLLANFAFEHAGGMKINLRHHGKLKKEHKQKSAGTVLFLLPARP
jgi:hypothetical protein